MCNQLYMQLNVCLYYAPNLMAANISNKSVKKVKGQKIAFHDFKSTSNNIMYEKNERFSKICRNLFAYAR